MHRRQPLPRLWLMTDERQGKALWTAIRRLPKGAGIIVRHYGLSPAERKQLLRKVRAEGRRRGLTVIFAGPPNAAAAGGAAGFHSRRAAGRTTRLIHTAPVHARRELLVAERAGADLLFLSPAFATRSHPDARPLGPLRFRLLALQARVPVIALGGMNAKRARRLEGAIHGWAGIDAWS